MKSTVEHSCSTRKATVMYLVEAPKKLVRTCSTFPFRENKRQVVSCNYVTNPKTTNTNLHACKYMCVCVCVSYSYLVLPGFLHGAEGTAVSLL